ncbi:hypothetical protein LDENG_00168450 [Lucifuga dentata]|nr:hypothetical protein LDENG_00168450 [Lucifuga dentata]
MKSLSQNCFYQLLNISKLWSVVPHSVFETIICAFISSRLDYCNSLFMYLNKSLLDSTGRTFRCSDQELLTIPWSKLKIRDDCVFAVVALRLWNSLLNNMRLAETVDSFKQLLKTVLYRQALN